MKRALRLTGAEINYWIDEYPSSETIKVEENCREFHIKKKKKNCHQKVAIEISLHKDAHSYGILGAEYIPQEDSNILRVNISYAKENSVLYNSELIKHDKTVYYGLPDECLENMFENIQKYMEINAFSGGILKIPFAVNSEVKSSPRFFGIMIEILLEIFSGNVMSESKEESENDHIIEEVFLNSAFFKKR